MTVNEQLAMGAGQDKPAKSGDQAEAAKTGTYKDEWTNSPLNTMVPSQPDPKPIGKLVGG